jgi:hypothetical protein
MLRMFVFHLCFCYQLTGILSPTSSSSKSPMTSWPSESAPPHKPAAPCAHAIPATNYTPTRTPSTCSSDTRLFADKGPQLSDRHMNFGQHYKGRYLSSNVNITVFDANNNSVSVPVGSMLISFFSVCRSR